MDTKIFALLVFVGVLGSFMEAQAAYFGYPYPYGNGQLRGPTSVNFVEMPRSKREIGDSNDPYNAGPGFLFPGQFPNFNDPTFDMIRQIQAQIEAQHQANMDLHNRLANDAANYGGGSYGGGVPQVASASIGLGPGGGFQAGQISPAAPGIESRFAEDLPAPSGNSFGVFASSSSSSMTGPDGKPIGHKSSVTGVNDNGKISYHSVHD
jgi:hypothetical protein